MSDRQELPKAPTGIEGLDRLTGGGLPRGRPTLVCGSAGCGKTLLAMEFLIRGATDYGEPGVFLSFEESPEDLAANVASLGHDVGALEESGLLAFDHVRIRREEIVETGAYDLEGLFLRIGFAVDRIGAKRVAIDTIETIFSGLENEKFLRSELVRLFGWLKDRGLTTVVTAEKGDGTLTRHGLEEYVSDCVIVLDHRIEHQVSTRRLRVLKYRGSAHGTNEYPFLISEDGVSVVPITSLGLRHPAPTERVSSGLPALDRILGGEGLYRGSSVLVGGSAGSGKTSLGASFIDAACRRGEKCLLWSFEESAPQILRNMASIGLDLSTWVEQGLLWIDAERPTSVGHEMHLARMSRQIEQFQPQVAVVDPINALIGGGSAESTTLAVLRLVDLLKSYSVTSLYTTLTHGGHHVERSDLPVSSLMDAWIVLRGVEVGTSRDMLLYVLKARGIAHSRDLHRLTISGSGLELEKLEKVAAARQVHEAV